MVSAGRGSWDWVDVNCTHEIIIIFSVVYFYVSGEVVIVVGSSVGVPKTVEATFGRFGEASAVNDLEDCAVGFGVWFEGFQVHHFAIVILSCEATTAHLVQEGFFGFVEGDHSVEGFLLFVVSFAEGQVVDELVIHLVLRFVFSPEVCKFASGS